MKAEVGVTHLQAKELQGLLAATRSWERCGKASSQPSERANPANTLTLDSQFAELRDNSLLWLKPLILCYQVRAAPGNSRAFCRAVVFNFFERSKGNIS